VLNSDMVIGVLTLLHSDTAQFDDNDLALLTIIANQASVALSNAQLFHNLQRAESKLQGILSAIPDPLVVLDMDDCVIMANDEARAMPAQGVNLEIGRVIDDCIAPDSPFQPLIALVHAAKPLKETQVWEVHSQHDRRDFQVQVSAWSSRGQSSEGHAIVVRDITAMRDLNRFKDEMLHLASHDLRSPLALIVGYCSLIELDVEPDSIINDHIQAIYRATTRMQGLLDDLLRAEKIRTAALELMDLTPVRALVSAALENVGTQFVEKQQSVSLDFDAPEDTAIRGNGPLLREALENYLLNAQKYTGAGGEVTLGVQVIGSMVHISVRDTGIGIPAESLGRVFEAFYRAHQAGTEQVEGRGFGLHLVKTIVERHGGAVRASSEVGVGSIFSMELPLA
jgi:signal transduction histidine kinase